VKEVVGYEWKLMLMMEDMGVEEDDHEMNQMGGGRGIRAEIRSEAGLYAGKKGRGVVIA
jgi:hypothetical protein